MKVETTKQFEKWLNKLKDGKAKTIILVRLKSLQSHDEVNGDWKAIGNDVIELRIHVGPGYRLYAAREQNTFLLLLIGGTKTSQERDIKQAKRILKNWRKDHAR